MGPAAGGRNRATNLETHEVVWERHEPVPSQTLPRHPGRPGRFVGAVRLPIAGPYRPWARIYRCDDGSLVGTVRLWYVDRPLLCQVDADVLRTFARVNRLRELASAIDYLLDLAAEGTRP